MKLKNILILAGGDSTRFWPLENKFLISFLGKLYIQYIFDRVVDFAEKIFIVVNQENKHMVETEISSRSHIIIQKSLEGMAGAIISCKDRIKGETLILGNDLFNYSIIPDFIDKKADMVLLAKQVTSYFPGGYLRLNGKKIQAIEEKPDPQKTPSNLVRLVADYIKDFGVFITAIEKTHSLTDKAYEEALTSIIQQRKATHHRYNDYWYPLKYPWHVLPMMQFFLKTLKKETIGHKTTVSKHALIIGPVYIGNNVKIGDFTKIVGPTYIGDNVIVGDHTLIRESHIGNNALVGGGTEVARSYIGERVMLHRNYVGDSVLDEGVLMGSGTVTANFRFDGKMVRDSKLQKLGAIIGKNAKIGVNSTLLPGVKVGKNTWIVPNEIIRKDIEDNQFVTDGENKRNSI